MSTAEPLARERGLILSLLVLLTLAAWVLLIRQAAGMGMTMGLTMGMAAWLFLAMWVVMMVAMMLPAAAPMILLFHRLQVGRRRRSEAFVATWVFVFAYLAVWALTGVLAWLAARGGDRIGEALDLSPRPVARVGGALIILAGLYQLSPLKVEDCLPREMPGASELPDDVMARRHARGGSHGDGSWRLVPRLLLAAVRHPVPARHDECWRDGACHVADPC
jgi:predicted metal-binding membrane protein